MSIPARGMVAGVEEVRLEPRCRVCRNVAVRHKVNDLLATGSSYAMIVRALDVENSDMDVRDRITIDSVRNHCSRHFPVQNAAAATYRAILERRAEENRVDFVNGVATAITPVAVLEAIMVKGFESLVASDTRIDANTAMAAATKLQTILDARCGQADIAEVFIKQERIIQCMREFVPPDKIGAMLARLEGAPINAHEPELPPSRSAGLRVYDLDVADGDDEDDY